jgi:large subunit ribosomal protein L19
MSQAIIDHVEKEQLRSDIPDISVGDTIDVHVRIVEGSKERVQVFAGVVLRITGTGMSRTFTVRRIVANEGVERIFPIHSPMIAKIEIKRHSHIRRSKLYYLRDRVGKKRRLPDRRRGLHQVAKEDPKEELADDASDEPGNETVTDNTAADAVTSETASESKTES